MHLLRSTALGTEVIENIDHKVIGIVIDLLIDADHGKLVALLLHVFGSSKMNAVQTQDIVSWGNRVHIRDRETVAELGDFIRLQPYLDDNRTIIGQKIQTEGGEIIGQYGKIIGRCNDVQFRTDTFDVEWIFPRKFFFWRGIALPASEILEVTQEAIIVKNQGPRGEEEMMEDSKEMNVQTRIAPATRCEK